MVIKNTFKIAINNFSLIWKIMLYKFVVLVITSGLIVGLVLPNVITIIQNIADTGLFENIKKLISDFFARGIDVSLNVESVKSSLDEASITVANNADRLAITYTLLAVIIIVAKIIGGMAEYTISDMINADMSSNAKYGFLTRFTVTLGKSFKYQLVKLITEFPCYIILYYIVWITFSFMFNLIGILALFFSIVMYILLRSCIETFFICWLPQMTVEKQSVFDSIRLGFNLSRKDFSKKLSYFILINLSTFLITVLLVFFTCGAGLIISMPLSALFIIIYRLVIFYEYKKYKYYVDINTIIDPNDRVK